MLESQDCKNFSGLKIISRKCHSDSRGEFLKIYNKKDLSNFGWEGDINQINQSFTYKRGFVRGMHMQFAKYSEYKLVTCIDGAIHDVVIDLRNESETFLDYFAVELSHENKLSLLIPPGFAHGFQALRDNSKLIYAHSQEYNQDFEGGCSAKDPDISINWPMPVAGLSSRDQELPLVKDLLIEKRI